MSKNVSLPVVRRLPRYYRFLRELMENGVIRISSGDLSRRMGLTASQIRQDLNCFGGFGQQGYGYNVRALYEEIGRIMGLGKHREAILVGAGNLGRAVSRHMDFASRGFALTGVFDVNPELVGRQIGEVVIQDIRQLEAFCAPNPPAVAILCIPKEAAPAIVKRLVALGVRGFWNFSHYDIALHYPEVVAENVHLGDSLSTLCYRINELEKQPAQPEE